MGPPTKFEIPDWRQYKVSGIKELEQLQKMLAAKGLKDPWIRNEVWRYQKENYPGVARSAFTSIFRGFKWAVLAVGVVVSVQNIFSKSLVIDKNEPAKCGDECEE